MLSRVALVRVPYEFHSSGRMNDAYLSHLASKLVELGVKVEVFDFHVRPDLEPQSLVGFRPELVVVIKHYASQQVYLRRFCANLKYGLDCDAPVALYGNGPGAAAESALRDRYADIVVLGDEAAFEGITRSWTPGRSFADIPGIAHLEGDSVKVNFPIPKIENLDRLPSPHLYHIKEEGYRKFSTGFVGEILTSRGCFANCSFCHVAYSRRIDRSYNWRGMSPERVADLLEEVAREGVRYVYPQDLDFFGPTRTRVLEIAQEMIERNLDIKMHVYTRTDDVVKVRDYLPIIKRAGINYLTLGVETFREEKLKLFNKGVSAETNRLAVELLREEGFRMQTGLILFTPESTLEQVRDELETVLTLFGDKPYLFKETTVLFTNFLQYYDRSKLKLKLLSRGEQTLATGHEQVYMTIMRKHNDPSYGPLPRFSDVRVGILGAVCYMVGHEVASKMAEVATRLNQLRSESEVPHTDSLRTHTDSLRTQIRQIVTWELNVNIFVIQLAILLSKEVEFAFGQGREPNVIFLEALSRAWNKFEEFNRSVLPLDLWKNNMKEAYFGLVRTIMGETLYELC